MVKFTPSPDGLLIPKPAIVPAPWLQESEKEGSDVLLELAERGRLVIHSPKYLKEKLAPLIADLEADLSERESENLARTRLIATGERFLRGRLNRGRYVYLNKRIMYHLDLKNGEPRQVAVLAVTGMCEIWTNEFYESIRSRLASTIRDHCTLLNY